MARKLFQYKNLLVLLILSGATLAVYSSVWLFSYAFSDDYGTIVPAIQGTLNQSFVKFIILGGRPIYAELLLMGFANIAHLSQLKILRFISVLGIAATEWVVYMYLIRSGWKKLSSISGAFLIGLVPTFQVYASWTIDFVFPWAAALSGVAIKFLERLEVVQTLKRRAIWVILAVVTLVVSFNIYQPAAMFFWVFAVIKLFIYSKNNLAQQKKLFARYLATFFLAALCSFGIQRLLLRIYDPGNTFNRAALTHDYLRKIKWFLGEPLLDAVNYTNLNVNRMLSIGIFFLILIGLFLYFQGSTKSKILQLAMAMLILPLSYLPNLAVVESWASFRSQPALDSVVLIYFILAFSTLKFVLNTKYRQKAQTAIIVAALSVFSIWTSFNVASGFVLPQYVELASIRMQIMEADLPHTKQIYLIAANESSSSAPLLRYDEFGLQSSSVEWGRQNAVFVVLNEIDKKYANIPVKVIKTISEFPKNEPGNMLVNLEPLTTLRSLFYF